MRSAQTVDPIGAQTSYAYSTRGDLTAVRNALGYVTRYADDGEHHLIRVEDAKGYATTLTWGGYHKLCDRTDANGNVVRLRYNVEGELTHVYNERGEVHQLTYTTDGRLRGELTFDGRELLYTSDPAGRVLRTRNGALDTTDLAYDLANRLVKRELPDGTVEEYRYDELGALIEAKNATGSFRFERDKLGRVIRETQVVDGAEHWVEVRYDLDGQRIGRKTSLGHTEEVARGSLGERVRTLLDGTELVRHQNDLLGREIARALPGGGWLQTRYDQMGRVVGRRAGGPAAEPWGRKGEPEWIGARPPGVTVDTRYRYDEVGELVESLDGSRGRTTYRYDRIGQLLAMVPEKARAELFKYDAPGNIYEADEGAPLRVYGPGNRLLRKGDTEYRWDGDGRLIEKRTRRADGTEEVWRYWWDGAGLLKMVERPDGLRCEFGYDPFARRVTKKVTTTESTPAGSFGASSTRTLWDGDVPVHTIEDDRRGNKLQRVERTLLFEETGFAPIAARQDEAPWLHCVATPAGALDALLTSAGELVERASTSAWGVAGTTASLGGVGLAGQVTDSEIGISYNRYRYYDPEAARFISPDPLGLAGGLNSFRYVPNVFGWSDPYGLDWNYRLRDANGSVYYVGRADDKATENAVMARHERTVGTTGARFGPTDTLERINGSVSRDAAMGVEHAGIVLGGTRTCPRRAKGQPKGSTPVRGNTDEGIGQEKLQTPEGQARLEAGLRVLKGSDPSTSTPVSRWRRDDSGRAVPA